ncbi:MAG: hypothetical protein KQI35_14365 [Bacteroidetes bacterium]|nr:hypothetical protein [Bacteroidota bacterium]
MHMQKEMINWIKNIFRKIFSSPSENYFEVSDFDYYSSFGLTLENQDWKINDDDKEKIKNAYNRAWENRDFEINKFWTRAAYFWGFIVLIFGAYFQTYNKEDKFEFHHLLIICTGIIFSIAWHYVIRGSKRWQENWENHIDKLEDFISGPLYKTIFHKNTFYSVSKINEILSVVIIIVWISLLGNYLNSIHSFPWSEEALNKPDFGIILTLMITCIFSLSIIYGYSRKKYKNDKGKFIRRNPRA